jgi:DivIVA domain-containing protein
MPLTPADVHNVAFKKPPIGKRGYDEEEVDAFLDEVERELARLIEENNELRAQMERGGGPARVPAGAGGDPRLAAEIGELKAQLDRVQRDKASAEQAARAMQAELEQVRGQGGPAITGDGEQQALRVLMMAQRTADDHVADARREADKLLTESRTKAEELTREARAKADALERDARQRHQEAMGGLDAKRTALQKHIEELKQFEREYRTRLKAYLESQLRDLDGRGQGLDTELGPRSEGARSGNPGLATAGAYGGRPGLEGAGR